jgi:hypothetical protein
MYNNFTILSEGNIFLQGRKTKQIALGSLKWIIGVKVSHSFHVSAFVQYVLHATPVRYTVLAVSRPLSMAFLLFFSFGCR